VAIGPVPPIFAGVAIVVATIAPVAIIMARPVVSVVISPVIVMIAMMAIIAIMAGAIVAALSGAIGPVVIITAAVAAAVGTPAVVTVVTIMAGIMTAIAAGIVADIAAGIVAVGAGRKVAGIGGVRAEPMAAKMIGNRRAVGVVIAVATAAVAARVAWIAAIMKGFAHPIDVMAGVSRIPGPAEAEVEEQTADVEGDADREVPGLGSRGDEDRRQSDNCECDQDFLHLRYLLVTAFS